MNSAELNEIFMQILSPPKPTRWQKIRMFCRGFLPHHYIMWRTKKWGKRIDKLIEEIGKDGDR